MHRRVPQQTRLALLLAAFLSGWSSTVVAQSVRLGAVLGLTEANIHVDDPSAPRWPRRSGVTAGIALSVRLLQGLSIQAELDYLERGSRQEGAPDFEMRSRYLEVPVFVRAALPRSHAALSPTIILGASLGWELQCGGRVTPASVGPPPPPVPLDCDSMRTDRFDAGFLMGAGLQCSSSRATVRLEGRFIRGLSDIGSGFELIGVFNRTRAWVLGVDIPVLG